MRSRFVIHLLSAAVAVLLLMLLAAPLVAQDSVATLPDSVGVLPEIASHAPGLAVALAAVSFLTFLAWQLVKWGSSKMDNLPGFAHKLAVFLVASGLTALGTMAGLPLPTTLDALTQDQLGQLLTWLVTILLGGGGAVATHAAKKATVG